MNALAQRVYGWARVQFTSPQLPEPEAINAKPRKMTGFFASLSPEQKQQALTYRGEESHGSADFRRVRQDV